MTAQPQKNWRPEGRPRCKASVVLPDMRQQGLMNSETGHDRRELGGGVFMNGG